MTIPLFYATFLRFAWAVPSHAATRLPGACPPLWHQPGLYYPLPWHLATRCLPSPLPARPDARYRFIIWCRHHTHSPGAELLLVQLRSLPYTIQGDVYISMFIFVKGPLRKNQSGFFGFNILYEFLPRAQTPVLFCTFIGVGWYFTLYA